MPEGGQGAPPPPVVDAGDNSFLEWTSRGRSAQGRDFEYRGDSVVEWSGDPIRAFRTYFDPRHLGRQIAPDTAV